jgi:hypothetical protein
MAGFLRDRISALVRDLLAVYGESESNSASRFDDVLGFILEQMDRMPWLPKRAIEFMTLLFGVSCFFHKEFPFFGVSPENSRKKQLRAWSHSPFRPCRDVVKFYAAMVVLSLYSDSHALHREGL